MIRTLLRSSILLTTLLAAPGLAGPPDPLHSTAPTCIRLVGRELLGTTPDPIGRFCVTVRDASDAAIAGALVEISFADCGDITLCDSAADPSVVVDCATRTVAKIADAQGVACFTLMGGAKAGPCPSATCATIRANGVGIGEAHVTAFDLDSGGNLSAADGSRWLDDWFGPHCLRIDCDCSGTLTAADFSFWQEHYFGSFVQGCDGHRCP